MDDFSFAKAPRWRQLFDEFLEKSRCECFGIKLALVVEKDLKVVALSGVECNKGRREKASLLWWVLRGAKKVAYLLFSVRRKCFPGVFDGAFVFVPHIENNLNSMVPLANELRTQGRKVTIVVPGSVRVYVKVKKVLASGIRVIFEPPVKTTGGDVEIDRVCHAFKKEINDFFYLDKGFERGIANELAIKGMETARLILYRTKDTQKVWRNSCPMAVLTARPKRVQQLPFLLAARNLAISRVYVPHTLWLKNAKELYRLYDLSLFSHSLAFSKKCAEEMKSSNPGVKTLVCGFPNNLGDKRSGDHCWSPEGSLRVGYAAGKDGKVINELRGVIEMPGIEFVVKTHPPGDNARDLAVQIDDDLLKSVKIKDHTEICLQSFFQEIDLLIGGRTNAGMEAAQFGVPVAGFYSRLEVERNQFMRHLIQAPDVAFFRCSEFHDLQRLVKSFRDLPSDQKRVFGERQRRQYLAHLSSWDRVKVCEALLSSLGHSP